MDNRSLSNLRRVVAGVFLLGGLLGALLGVSWDRSSGPASVTVLANPDAGIVCFVAEPPHSGMQCVPLSFFDGQEEQDPATYSSTGVVDTLVPIAWLHDAHATRDSLKLWASTRWAPCPASPITRR